MRFLERSRPWILQHLTELLTPRTLQKPGADGRPTIEYIRDVYNDLVNMGEGMRAKGDRSDISSDDAGEDEYLEKLRREWARNPLSKASAALAKLWLQKARKRQVYMKLAQPLIDSALETVCSQCERTADSGAVMKVVIAKEGRPYPNRLDEIIYDFERQQGGAEFDPVLWKAHFRANAQFVTRCNFCYDLVAQMERAKRADKTKKPLMGASRAVDISSDDDDEGPTYPPLVVSRGSSEAKVVYKWLTAARRRLGGVFPRPHAKDEMEARARQIRNARAARAKREIEKKAKQDAGDGEHANARFGKFRCNAATKALAQLWMQLGKKAVVRKRREKTDQLRTEVTHILEQLRPEDDWYYGIETRTRGGQIQRDGEQLLVERTVLENEEEETLKRLRGDQKVYEDGKEAERMVFVHAMEKTIEEFRVATKAQTDERVAELVATRRDREMEFAAKEAAANAGQRAMMHEAHVEQLEGLTLNIQVQTAAGCVRCLPCTWRVCNCLYRTLTSCCVCLAGCERAPAKDGCCQASRAACRAARAEWLAADRHQREGERCTLPIHWRAATW
jgi:hypothetical protein